MGRLSNISGKEAVKAFQKAGWKPIGQVGSHKVMIKPKVHVNLSIPQHKELSVGEIAEIIGVSISAVSHTLNKLKEADLVEDRRDFRHVYYQLKQSPLTEMIRGRLKKI